MLRDFEYLTTLPGTAQEQAWIQERLDTLSVREGMALTAAAAWHPPETLADAINHLQSLDNCDVCFPAGCCTQLGELYMRRETRIPEDAFPYVNLHQLGQQYEDAHPGLFVGDCYVVYPRGSDLCYDGSHLPADDGWSVKVKLSSPAVPDGVWLRLPGRDGSAFLDSDEIQLALHELDAESLEECTLLEARCILPEAGDLMAQYGSVTELVFDGNNLGFILDEQGQGEPDYMDRFAAALELENCRTLRLALDIAQNLHCYDWISSESLESHAISALLGHGVKANLIQSGVIDLKRYAEALLETSGYMAVNGETGYVRRSGAEFSYEYRALKQAASQGMANISGLTEAVRQDMMMGGCKMVGEMQAPISRKDFQEWAGADYRLYENIRQADGSVLGCTKHDLLPEVNALFVGSPEKLHATMDLCGLYDKRLGEFRYITKELAAVVDGLSEPELWDRSTQGPNLLQLVTSYAKNAAEHGYKTQPYAEVYDQQEQTVRKGLNAMTAYAGVLAARGEENAVLELRDLAMYMREFWQDYLYSIYKKAGARMERQYSEKFDQAVTAARASGQPPAFNTEKARAILRGLSVHAEEEAVGNENLYSVWECSRLAKRIWDEYPSVKTAFCGNFVVDTREQYTELGSTGSVSQPEPEQQAKGMEMGGI